MKSLKSVSLACRVVLDMHALNNEGNESNRLMTRQVGVVTPVQTEEGASYRRDTVNAISGDMQKHIFASAFRDFALDMGLPMNPLSQALDPARIMADPDFEKYVKGEHEWQDKSPEPAQVIDMLLTCALTDVCGIMITAGRQSIKRKSAVEFGWTVGLPDITQTAEFIHARHAINRLQRFKVDPNVTGDERKEQQARARDEKEANTGQMIFNRPASSGVYAFVAHLDVSAIGFNDATQQYPQSVTYPQTANDVPINRDARLRAALMSLAQTVLHPKGALTSTQLPHVVDVEGFVSMSTSAAAAPLISPLNDDYIARAEKTATLLNQLHGSDSVTVQRFKGNEGLLEQMVKILDDASAGKYVRYDA